MRLPARHPRRRLVEYDALRGRLWILALTVTGGALMVHDWKDRGIWFERGRGTQP
jgi:hypothetical protein